MIIKSHIRGGYLSAAQYLKEQGRNETTRLVELSDPSAKNLDDAFQNMWAVACKTKCTKPLHHISINPMKDERLTDKQVQAIADRCEEKYGYQLFRHQRVIVEHVKDGRQHFHVIWNRVNLETGKPVWPGEHWNKSKQVCREMEKELGLKRPVLKRMKSSQRLLKIVKGRKKQKDRVIRDISKFRNVSGRGFGKVRRTEAKGLTQKKSTKRVRNKTVVITRSTHSKSRHTSIRLQTVKPALKVKASKARSSIHSSVVRKTAYSTNASPVKKNEIKPSFETKRPVQNDKTPNDAPKVIPNNASDNAPNNAPNNNTGMPQITSGRYLSLSPTKAPSHKPMVAKSQEEKVAPEPTPHPPARGKSGGWPPAAVRDWNDWGSRNPPRFFARWPELAM